MNITGVGEKSPELRQMQLVDLVVAHCSAPNPFSSPFSESVVRVQGLCTFALYTQCVGGGGAPLRR
jgi:hypothetical protein